MSVPDNSNVSSIRHESKTLGFESPTVRGIFCPTNYNTFTRTSIRVSKTKAVARAQLSFQILTLLQIYIPYKIMDAITYINI